MSSFSNTSTLSLFLLISFASVLFATANPKFLLSCRVIAGICQGDGECLDEMSSRFPDCYLEGQFVHSAVSDLLPQKGDLYASRPMDAIAGVRHPLEKRAPAMKLMKVLMMKDRIPVGRK